MISRTDVIAVTKDTEKLVHCAHVRDHLFYFFIVCARVFNAHNHIYPLYLPAYCAPIYTHTHTIHVYVYMYVIYIIVYTDARPTCVHTYYNTVLCAGLARERLCDRCVFQERPGENRTHLLLVAAPLRATHTTDARHTRRPRARFPPRFPPSTTTTTSTTTTML